MFKYILLGKGDVLGQKYNSATKLLKLKQNDHTKLISFVDEANDYLHNLTLKEPFNYLIQVCIS